MSLRLVLIGFLVFFIALSSKASVDDFDLKTAKVYGEVERLIEKGDSVGIFNILYREDSVVAGEGLPAVARNKSEVLKIIDSLLAEVRSCRIHQDSAKGVSSHYSYTFVTYKCLPKNEGDVLSFRALYVWEERNGELKVVAELFGVGRMN